MHRYSHNGNYFPEPIGAAAGCQREAPLTFVSLDGGLVLGIKGFVAANLGGRGSHRGAVMGGLAFGVLERLSAGYIASTYKDSSAFALFTLILAIRPAGLFRSRARAHDKGGVGRLLRHQEPSLGRAPPIVEDLLRVICHLRDA